MSRRASASHLSRGLSTLALGMLVACSDLATTPLDPAPVGEEPSSVGLPNGDWEIAFVSDRDFEGPRSIGWGRYDVYLMTADGGDVFRLTSGVSDVNSASLSPDRTRIAIGDGDRIKVVDLTGSGDTIVAVPGRAFTTVPPAWSPDGSRLALTMDVSGWFDLRVYLVDADGSNLIELADGAFPTWSPDGTRIAFNRMDEDGDEIWVTDVDGAGLVNITRSAGHDFWPDWSPDGDRIAFTSTRSGDFDIYVINVDGSGLRNLTAGPAFDGYPQWSPDGSKIAFLTNRTGDGEIFVINADGSDPINLTRHPAVDAAPAW